MVAAAEDSDPWILRRNIQILPGHHTGWTKGSVTSDFHPDRIGQRVRLRVSHHHGTDVCGGRNSKRSRERSDRIRHQQKRLLCSGDNREHRTISDGIKHDPAILRKDQIQRSPERASWCGRGICQVAMWIDQDALGQSSVDIDMNASHRHPRWSSQAIVNGYFSVGSLNLCTNRNLRRRNPLRAGNRDRKRQKRTMRQRGGMSNFDRIHQLFRRHLRRSIFPKVQIRTWCAGLFSDIAMTIGRSQDRVTMTLVEHVKPVIDRAGKHRF